MYSLVSTVSSTLSNINISLEFLIFTFLQLLQYLSLGQQVDFPTDGMGNILKLIITVSAPVNTLSHYHYKSSRRMEFVSKTKKKKNADKNLASDLELCAHIINCWTSRTFLQANLIHLTPLSMSLLPMKPRWNPPPPASNWFSWFEYYLPHRSGFVAIGGARSHSHAVGCVVSQRSEGPHSIHPLNEKVISGFGIFFYLFPCIRPESPS